MNLKVKKLNDKAVIMAYETEGSVGMDLTAVTEKILDIKTGAICYGTGLAVEIPEGYEAQIRPRSSIYKKDLFLVNPPGTIDSDYRGEIKVIFKPTKFAGASKYNVGDRIAQLVVSPISRVTVVEVDELSETVRDEGGFGSTGE